MNGLTRVQHAVLLSGPMADLALKMMKIARRNRRLSGLPLSEAHEQLIAALEAVSSTRQCDDAVIADVPDLQPTVPIREAADRMNIGIRQAQRKAPQLGGKKIGGQWFVDELALREHLDGKNL